MDELFYKLPPDCLDKVIQYTEADYNAVINMASSCLYLKNVMRDISINFNKIKNEEDKKKLLSKLFIHLLKILIELFKIDGIDLIVVEAPLGANYYKFELSKNKKNKKEIILSSSSIVCKSIYIEYDKQLVISKDIQSFINEFCELPNINMVFSLEIFDSFKSPAACKTLKLINELIQTSVRTPTTPTPPQQLIAQLDTDPVKNIEKIKEYFSSTEVKTILMNEGNDALLAKIKTLAPPPITYPPPPTSV